MNNIEDTDKLPVDDQKRLRVHLVPMPSGDNPWRTQKDYLNDKKRDNIKFWIIIGGFIISIISATASYMQMTEARNERIEAEKALAEANLAKESVKETATALLKISYILADGSSRWGGVPQEHKDKIKEYQQSIGNYLDKNLENELKNDIKELNTKIEKRTKK